MIGIVCLVLAVVATLSPVIGTDSSDSSDESPFGTFPDTCLDLRTKDSPSPEAGLPECEEWQDLSCCTAERAGQLADDGIVGLAFITDVCGEFSPQCKQFSVANGCFYHCEPMLQHFQHPNRSMSPLETPICAQYCDEWFEACKDDLTCVGDWLTGFFLDPASRDCPADGSECVTYVQMYGDAKGLCNTIYSFTYKYEASNENCMVMQFEGENPNLNGDPYRVSSSDSSSESASSDDSS